MSTKKEDFLKKSSFFYGPRGLNFVHIYGGEDMQFEKQETGEKPVLYLISRELGNGGET